MSKGIHQETRTVWVVTEGGDHDNPTGVFLTLADAKAAALRSDEPMLKFDREPQAGDGPDYHAEHAAWRTRNRKREHGSDEDLLVLFSQPGTTRRNGLRSVYNAGLSRAAEIVQAKMDITGDRDEAPEALRDIRTAIEKEREVNV